MIQLSEKYPEFGFEKHKGYGTKKHIEAIQEFGYLICHRKTFQLKNLNPK
jgi:ribonuclease HII